MRVVGRVVVPGNRSELRSGLEQSRLRQSITQLPVEVVVDAQQHFNAPIVMNNVVFKSFSPEMHVREQAQQGGIVWQSPLYLHAKVVGSRRNNERMIIQLNVITLCCGRFLANTKPKLV